MPCLAQYLCGTQIGNTPIPLRDKTFGDSGTLGINSGTGLAIDNQQGGIVKRATTCVLMLCSAVLAYFSSKVEVFDASNGTKLLSWSDDNGAPLSQVSSAVGITMGPGGLLHIVRGTVFPTQPSILKYTLEGSFVGPVYSTAFQGAGEDIDMGDDGLYYSSGGFQVSVDDQVGTNIMAFTVGNDFNSLAGWQPSTVRDVKTDRAGRLVIAGTRTSSPIVGGPRSTSVRSGPRSSPCPTGFQHRGWCRLPNGRAYLSSTWTT